MVQPTNARSAKNPPCLRGDGAGRHRRVNSPMQPKRAPTSPITNCRLTAVRGVVSHAVASPTKSGAYPGLASHAEAQRRGPITVHSAGRILPALRSRVLSISSTSPRGRALRRKPKATVGVFVSCGSHFAEVQLQRSHGCRRMVLPASRGSALSISGTIFHVAVTTPLAEDQRQVPHVVAH